MAGLQLAAGLALLVAGGDLLVRGASRLAAVLGVPPLVIGLTVVAFGTSAPELAVSLDAGLRGRPDIAVGNVVGSNVFNTLFILGLCALIRPLVVSVRLVRREVPIMVAVSALLYWMGRDGLIGVVDGALLGTGIVAYTVWSVTTGRREAREDETPQQKQAGGPARHGWLAAALATLLAAGTALARRWVDPMAGATLAAGALAVAMSCRRPGRAAGLLMQVGLVIAGLGLLVIGAQSLIGAATGIARAYGVTDLVIGLTIVAAGTSLPEVATSVMATLRGERDLAIGNVVGSNIFNILGILGVSALVVPGGLPVHGTLVAFDMPVMLAAAVVCVPFAFTGLRIDRWEGALFLGSYVAYTALVVLAAVGETGYADLLGRALLLAAPLVVLVLVWSVWQGLRRAYC